MTEISIAEISKDKIIVRRSKRKTLSIEITADARVLVRAPLRMPQAQIQKFISEKSRWIEDHVTRAQERLRGQAEEETLTEQQIRELADRALKIIPERAAFYAEKMGVTYGRITIRKQKTRWGSCSGEGNLNFNCLLMLAPPEVLDYVVVHELCHRREMNHSPAFWGEVEKVLPGYKEQRKWLRENGSRLLAAAGIS